MNRLFIALMAGVSILFSFHQATATPSQQIRIPSTDTQAARTVHLGVDNRFTILTKAKDGGHSEPTDIGATVGLADTHYFGVEGGIDLREHSNDPLFINFKVQLKEDSISPYVPAFAIGGYEFGSTNNDNDANIFYVLMAKSFPVAGRFSLGYYIGNDNVLIDSSGAKENDGVLASFDRRLAEINEKLWVALDFMSGANKYGAMSAGFSWYFSDQISALLGYSINNSKDVAGEDTFTIQFDMDF